MKNQRHLLFGLLTFLCAACATINPLPVSPESLTTSTSLTIKKWEKLSLTFDGPATSETAEDNPFLNYRLIVHFKHAQKTTKISGFYDADGNAAETSATGGTKWRVYFRPDLEGEWTYEVSFRKGRNIAISDDLTIGEGVAFDGKKGTILVTPNPENEGRLEYVGERYLQYADSKRFFLKGGTDSPENFLGYADFDGTKRYISEKERSGEATQKKELHQYAPHIVDWKEGDPTWQNGKGKGIIGALNYLASKGMNSVYFLTMNINGDGKDVYPYTSYEERLRFDCSKLAQWEIVFDHMDQLGLMLHVVLQETENELLLDDGNTTFERKLYYRELIARFAHHPKLKWNMGEENGPVHWAPEGQSTEQQKAMVEYIKTNDPYQNYLVIHSHSDRTTQDKLFTPLLGMDALDGISLQIADRETIHATTKRWLAASAAAGKQWVLPMDEIGPYWRGVDPDDRVDNNQDTVRHLALWGNLMAGGAGAEWYFGYKNHNDDLGCEDWRTRDRMWDYTRYALQFFERHLPFSEMTSQDELITAKQGYCFAKTGELYSIYIPNNETTTLDLTGQKKTFSIAWYNPRTGGGLHKGLLKEVQGGGVVDIGSPPGHGRGDWVALLTQMD